MKHWHLPALAICCAAFSLVMVWDMVVPFDGLAYKDGDPHDSGQMTWNLWHVADSVLHARNPFETTRAYYPVGVNLAKHTLVSGFVPLTLLVRLFSGNGPLWPIYAFNIAVWLSYTMLLLFSYLTLRALGFGMAVSIVPAIGFAFSDFYYFHATHLNLLAGFFMPLCALLLIRLCRAPSRWRAIALAAAVAYSAYFTQLFISIVLALAIFGLVALVSRGMRLALLRLLQALGWRTLLASLLVFAGIIAPLCYEYVRCKTLLPPREDFYRLSANLAGYFVPARHTTWLYGDLLRPLQDRITTGWWGFEIFLGYPFLVCLVAGLFRPRRYHVGLYVVALTFLVLSLGPYLKVLNHDVHIRLPYGWLMQFPPFNQERCPSRLSTVAMFACLPIAAAGLKRILGWVRRHLCRTASLAVWGVFLAWTVLETYSPATVTHGHFQIPTAALAQLGPGPVTYLPLAEKPCAQSVLQTLHGHRSTNGCLARHTPAELIWANDLDRSFREDLWHYIALLNQARVQNILVVSDVEAEKLRVLQATGFNVIRCLTKETRP